MPDVRIAVEAKARGTSFCPVAVDLDMPSELVADLALLDEARGVAVPSQVESTGAGCRVHWIVDSLAAGQRRTYRLTEAVAAARGPEVELGEEPGGKIQVRIGGELFTNYHCGDGVPRPVLYPVIGPFGQGVTRAYPMEEVEGDVTDHVHHRSIWVAWGDVNGSDNWSETPEAGRVAQRQLDSLGGGAAFGWVASRNDWLDAAGKKLMEDATLYRFYNTPASMRLVDLEVAFHAGEGPVRFGDTKEGGFCSVRVAPSMNGDVAGRIETAFGGIGEPECWGKRAHWCDYSGPVAGHTVGIAIFDHPGNVNHPTYWHVRDYGLMTANPFGLSHFVGDQNADGSYVLPAGAAMTFRYRILVHAGNAAEGGVKNRYLDWVYPPATEVVE